MIIGNEDEWKEGQWQTINTMDNQVTKDVESRGG
jgi:hypothetical protein